MLVAWTEGIGVEVVGNRVRMYFEHRTKRTSLLVWEKQMESGMT